MLPGPLDEHGWALMREHPVHGEALVRAVPDLRPSRRSSATTTSAGTARGYPDGLAGDAIPLEARILAAVDAYSAMTTHRPYRAAMADARRSSELERCRRQPARPGRRRRASLVLARPREPAP